MLKQNMDFFKTVRTDMNDNRLIDMQRENDALKEHNQTLVAQLAEKDSLVKMYLSKIESLSEQFSRLEGKIQSTHLSMQQNMTP
jgi:predicted nuclease with TOPRIM domain